MKMKMIIFAFWLKGMKTKLLEYFFPPAKMSVEDNTF